MENKKPWICDPWHICIVAQACISLMVLIVLVVFGVRMSDKLYIRVDGAGWTIFLWIIVIVFVIANIVVYISMTKLADGKKKEFMIANIILPIVAAILGLSFGIPMRGSDVSNLALKVLDYIETHLNDPIWLEYYNKLNTAAKAQKWLEERTTFCGEMVFGFVAAWTVIEVIYIIWVNCCKIGSESAEKNEI